MPKTVPQRTCIGCRTKKPKEELVRITLDLKGNITLDKTGTGRGTYLCKSNVNCQMSNVSTRCLEQAIKKNAFKHAFKEKIKKIKILPGRKTANCNCNGPC